MSFGTKMDPTRVIRPAGVSSLCGRWGLPLLEWALARDLIALLASVRGLGALSPCACVRVRALDGHDILHAASLATSRRPPPKPSPDACHASCLAAANPHGLLFPPFVSVRVHEAL